MTMNLLYFNQFVLLFENNINPGTIPASKDVT